MNFKVGDWVFKKRSTDHYRGRIILASENLHSHLPGNRHVQVIEVENGYDERIREYSYLWEMDHEKIRTEKLDIIGI